MQNTDHANNVATIVLGIVVAIALVVAGGFLGALISKGDPDTKWEFGIEYEGTAAILDYDLSWEDCVALWAGSDDGVFCRVAQFEVE